MKLFGTFSKVEEQEDGTVKVFGIASSETEDAQGEIVKASAIEKAMPDYLKFGAVREMHTNSAAGTAIEMSVTADGRTSFGALVVDPVAIKKVQTGVYKGFSIGGRVTERDPANKSVITGIKLTEISLVDRPANPDSVFSLYKADVGSESDDSGAQGGAPSSEKTPEVPARGAAPEAAPDPAAAPAAAAASGSDAAAAQADGAEKSDKKTSLSKSMHGVTQLAGLIESIQWLAQDTQWEADWEKDGSPVPAQLRDWLKTGVGILQAMTAEETAELVALAEPEEVIILTDGTKDLAKAGARHSKKDKEHVQSMHDSSVALGADCGAAKAAAPDDLAKIADDLSKVTTQRDELLEKVKKLEAEPEAPKGVARVIEKTDDSVVAKKEEEEEPKTPLELMKKAHAEPHLIKL